MKWGRTILSGRGSDFVRILSPTSRKRGMTAKRALKSASDNLLSMSTKGATRMPGKRSPEDRRIMREVGERMQKARKSMGLTQEQFGEKTGDKRIANRLSLYETGGDHMGMLVFFRITKALNLTPNDLAPRTLFPEGMSITDDFLSLTQEQQQMIRNLIRMLKEGNNSAR